MTFDGNIDMLEMAFWQIILSSAPVLLIALAIGLFIGIIQAATSINEMTLSFVPKVILVMLTLLVTANFLFISLSDYFQFIFDQISAIN
tara:strand:- start:733 stop:999 length:267 start_codon:yes stop_codon:yes gene_type:complete